MGSSTSLGGFLRSPGFLVRGTTGRGHSSREVCLGHHGPNYPNELKGKALDPEERGFEGLGQAILLLAEGPSWPRLSTWLPERPRPCRLAATHLDVPKLPCAPALCQAVGGSGRQGGHEE